MLESELEAYFRIEVKRIGGKAYKWVSPGNTGVPDRIVLYRGKVYFVELKKCNARPNKVQILRHDEIRGLGHGVCIIDTKVKVDLFVNSIKGDDAK